MAALALLGGACSSGNEPSPIPGAPSIACPVGFSANSQDGKPVVMSYGVPAATGGAPPVTVSCSPVSGTAFPIGVTTVTCTARDALGRQASCGFNVQISSPPQLVVTVFMAFGDSLTEGKPAVLYEEWPISYRPYLQGLLRDRYTGQAPSIIPAGLGGETAVKGVSRLPNDLAIYRPEAVLLMEGANDLVGGASRVQPAADAMRQMVVTVRSAGGVPLLATIPPQREGGSRARGAPYVNDYNDRLRAVARETGTILVDVWAAFGGEASTALVDVDGLHLTEAGYHRVGDAFFTAIKANLELR